MKKKSILIKAAEYISSLDLKNITNVQSYKEIECINKVRNFQVNFPVGFVLHTFSYINNDEFIGFKKTLITYLKEEVKDYSFNYFTKKFNQTNTEFLLPDDLDDTSLLLSSLTRNNVPIDPKFFIKIINLETSEGGPYISWYISKKPKYAKWMDIDPVINAHLLYLCSLNNIKLKSTEEYIIKCFKENKLNSPYYSGELFFMFYLAKYLASSNNAEIRKLLVKKVKKLIFKKLNKIDKILYGLTINYLGEKLSSDKFKEITSFQERDGSVSEFAICTDYPYDGAQTYTSNKAVITALWLELIIKQKDISKVKPHTLSKGKVNSIYKIISKRTKKLINTELDKTIFKSFILDKYPLDAEYKVINLPISIALDLKPLLKEEDINLLSVFCTAGYFGWIAYTILDDYLDNKTWSPVGPIINLLNRLQYKYLDNLFNNRKISKEILNGFLVTDEYYYNEAIQTLRNIKSYTYIEKRMQAFLTIMKFLPLLLEKREHKRIGNLLYKLLRNIQIIDQLNDDAHDWEEDIGKNIITYVTSKLINQDKKKKEIKDYTLLFWNIVMPQVIESCKKVYLESKKLLKTTNFKNIALILDKSFNPMLEANEEISNVQKIVETYSK